MTLFYPWWLHDLWGLWVMWSLPHIASQYYSKNMVLDFVLKNILLSAIWDNCAKNIAQSLSWKSKFPPLFHLKSYYCFLKIRSKNLCKSRFPFFFKCENIFLFGNTLSRYNVSKKWTSNFTLYSTRNSSLKTKLKQL